MLRKAFCENSKLHFTLVLADTRADGETPEGLEARRAVADGLRANGAAAFVEGFVPRAMWPGRSSSPTWLPTRPGTRP